MKLVKNVFNQEFRTLHIMEESKNFYKLAGGRSLMFEPDAARHQFLRRLVGQGMTPEAVNAAMPALIKSATDQIDELTMIEPVRMELVLKKYTLYLAWRQILGLDLREDEIETFDKAVSSWISGLITPLVPLVIAFPNLFKYTKGGRALNYLVSKINGKIDALLKSGPDGSTLSRMVFAMDEEDPTKSLTRDEIISNSMLLISAGSETSSSTLTVAILASGLNKHVFKMLKEEQLAMIAKHGVKMMTRDMLEDDCPYLDAVVKETMRIKPIAFFVGMRVALETIIVEDNRYQRVTAWYSTLRLRIRSIRL